MWKKTSLVATAVWLTACQTTPQTQELLSQNEALQEQLIAANTKITSLEVSLEERQASIDELNRVLNILETEKSSRVQESSQLRGQVRQFVQQQIDNYKDFLVRGNLLDYIGGELVERSQTDETALFLVDIDHPVPSDGSLTGVGAYFTTPTPFQVKLLRPIDDQKMVVIWESQPIAVDQTGPQRFEFPVTVGIEAGDYLGYYFPEATGVSFDTGTGNTRYTNKDLELGETLRRSSLSGEGQKRAYSIGVYGLLKTTP